MPEGRELKVKVSSCAAAIIDAIAKDASVEAEVMAGLIVEGYVSALVLRPFRALLSGMPSRNADAPLSVGIKESAEDAKDMGAAVAKAAKKVVAPVSVPEEDDDEPLEGLDLGLPAPVVAEKPAAPSEKKVSVKASKKETDSSGDLDDLSGLDLSDSELDLSLPEAELPPVESEEKSEAKKPTGKKPGRKKSK